MLAGLRHVLVGGSLHDDSAPTARRFTGWTTIGHWIEAADAEFFSRVPETAALLRILRPLAAPPDGANP